MDKSRLTTDDASNDLYMYSLRKMAESNAQKSRSSITNLMGTNAFFYKGNEVMRENPNEKYALVRMDLYRFKTVNEFLGREVGDNLLVYISDIFISYESTKIAVGHLRADIFCLCMPYDTKEDIIKTVTDIRDKIDEFEIACKILPAFGICLDGNNLDVSLMVDYANLALQEIKGKVFSFYAFYTSELRHNLLYEKQIENEIISAIRNGEIRPFIQPKVDIGTEKVIGGEALVRWFHPVEGIRNPGDFIPILEKSGYIIDLDIFMWEEIFKLLNKWITNNYNIVPISINISRMHKYNPEFIDTIVGLSEKYQVPPKYVKLELLESAFGSDIDELYSAMGKLRKKGFLVSMDDFGSGYSSMSMLKDQPVDEIKLDREFLNGLKDEKGAIIVRNIIHMIHELDMDMIAEGVETMEQANLLTSCGCYKAQGFYYYKPMEVGDFEKLLIDNWGVVDNTEKVW